MRPLERDNLSHWTTYWVHHLFELTLSNGPPLNRCLPSVLPEEKKIYIFRRTVFCLHYYMMYTGQKPTNTMITGKYNIIRAFRKHIVLRSNLPLHIRSKLFLQALKNISSLHMLTPFSTNANSVSQRSSVKASKISPRRTTGIVGVHISCRQVSMQNVT